jgi:hypothetical protein
MLVGAAKVASDLSGAAPDAEATAPSGAPGVARPAEAFA